MSEKVVHLKNSSEAIPRPQAIDAMAEAYRIINAHEFNATDAVVILIDRRPATGRYALNIVNSGGLDNTDLVSAFEIAKDFTLRKKMQLL